VEGGGVMSVIKQGKRRTKPFFQVARSTIEDKDLSWEARGLLCYLLSKPENWTVRMSDLGKKGPAGKYIIRRIVQELIDQGYMTREPSRGEKGKLSGWEYTVYEDKQINRSAGLPTDGETDRRLNRQTAEPTDGKLAPSNKELNSNKENREIPPISPTGGLPACSEKSKKPAREKKSYVRDNPPTLEEVVEHVGKTGKGNVNPYKFYAQYSDPDVNWTDKNGKPYANWKQMLATWNSNGFERNVWVATPKELDPAAPRAVGMKRQEDYLTPEQKAEIERQKAHIEKTREL
jgi:hypothetical protein